MTAYYNEIDPYAAQWLRNLIRENLIAAGDVDERSIVDVRPDDLRGYAQCHFFAGIGGWSLALRLAGWDDARPAWTGSCPCQPLSSAGQQRGHADERHLWPAFHRLIAECRPPVVFGEQVASKDGREWFAAVRSDLERLGYACGAADLPAASVGAPHIRQRLWFVANAIVANQRGHAGSTRSATEPSGGEARSTDGNAVDRSGPAGLLADACGAEWRPDADARQGRERQARGWNQGAIDFGEHQPARLLADGSRRQPGPDVDCGENARDGAGRPRNERQPGADSDAGELADADAAGRLEQRSGRLLDGERTPQRYDADGCGEGDLANPTIAGRGQQPQRDAGTDGRPAAEPGRLCDAGELGDADGEREGAQRGICGGAATERTRSPWSDLVWLPCSDGKARPTQPGLFPLAHGIPGRVGRLRAYGNAIVPQVAAKFIEAASRPRSG